MKVYTSLFSISLRLSFVFLFVIFSVSAYSQSERKRANYWHFGFNAGLDFSCLPPESFSGSPLSSGEGSASISDLDGNLMMFTDGVTVWDASGSVMPNGTGLLGSQSTVQTAVIIPNPTQTNIYYIFTGGTSIEEQGEIGVHYSEVDMNLNGGMGAVTANKNVFLFKKNEEKLTAVANANNDGYWVVAQEYDSNTWYAYEVTSAGVNMTPVISTTGPKARFQNSLCAKLSPDGTMLATQNQCDNNYSPSVCLYDFNNSTGEIEFLWEDCGAGGVSLEFSPDCSKLYATSGGGIYQYDLEAGTDINDSGAIIASKTEIINTALGSGMFSLQLGNDCKLYIGKGLNSPMGGNTNYMGVINDPNNVGIACNLVEHQFDLVSGMNSTRLTNFVTSFFYDDCEVLSFELEGTDAGCQADGTINLTITAGVAPFYFDWSNGETTQNLSGLSGGWYHVTVTDDYGNCKRDSIYIQQDVQTVLVEETITYPDCGEDNGSIELDISLTGGDVEELLNESFETDGEGTSYTTTGYYVPSGPIQNKFFKRGQQGDFNFFGGSVTGQEGNYFFAAKQPESNPVSLTMNPITIDGYYDLELCVYLAATGSNPHNNDGISIQYRVDGGSWNTVMNFKKTGGIGIGSLAEDTNGDGIGNGTTLNGEFQDFCYSIPASGNEIEIEIELSAVGSTTGLAFDFIRLYGIPPVTYSLTWSPNGETTENIYNLSPGEYQVDITVSNGCEATYNYTIIDPCDCTPPELFITNINECSSSANLNNAIDPSSDAANVTFYNSETDAENGSNPIGASVTSSGIYWVRAESPNLSSCYEIYEIHVEFTTLEYTVDVTMPSCGAMDGTINITVTNGESPYEYSIDGGNSTQSSGNFTGLGVGNYNIVITDANGCEATDIQVLNNPDGPQIENVQTIKTACATDNGEIIIQASGGTGSFEYSVDGGNNFQSSSTFSNLGEGSYNVVVKDENGCEAFTIVSIEVEDAPTLTLEDYSHITCNGESDGSISVTATGGTPDYSYSWYPDVSSSNTAENLSSGMYIITVTDSEGCEDEIEVTISEPSEIQISADITGATCGINNGSISLNVTGGSGNYNYDWEGGISTTPVANGLLAGSYLVTITDTYGCSVTQTFEVMVTGNFAIEVEPESVTITSGESVELNLYIDPNVNVSTITWTPPSGLSCTDCTNPIATPSETTTYFVTVVDESGCVSTDSVLVRVELPCREVAIPNTFTPNNDGNNDFQCVLGDCIVSMEFKIFNRWGEMVFSTEGQEECWDGTFRGQEAQSGVYYYYFIGTLKNGDRVEDKGSITLVR